MFVGEPWLVVSKYSFLEGPPILYSICCKRSNLNTSKWYTSTLESVITWNLPRGNRDLDLEDYHVYSPFFSMFPPLVPTTKTLREVYFEETNNRLPQMNDWKIHFRTLGWPFRGYRDAQLSSIWRRRNQIQESRNDPGPSPGAQGLKLTSIFDSTAHLRFYKSPNDILGATILNQSKYLKQICSRSF